MRIATLLVALAGPLGAQEAPVDFARDVRPILADRCFPCHGPDAGARKAELRLDRAAQATADRGGYAAVVPGDPGASALVARIRHPDPAERMPPPESKLTLDDGERALLERWIAAGAPYAEHWAFVPPARPTPPAVRDAGWPRDPLDAFVLARLEAAGLAPAPEAAPGTWLRRASYDLTGLPPTSQELDAFLADVTAGGEDAYGRAADRLLASPRYGERMASDWLDVARYADTYGYQNDRYREVWPWRDWVVEAFDANLPYDEFVVWQVAGDLLPGATREQRLATAFNRLHRQTNEGGSVEEEFRVEYVSDRVHTFGTAFLGLTLECARCHDHKFDPVSQREYYALSAFFAQIDECGLYSHFTDAVPTPALALPTAEQEARLVQLEEAVLAAEAGLAQVVAARGPAYEAWLAEGGLAEDLPGGQGRYAMDEAAGGALENALEGGAAGALHGANRRCEGFAGGGVELTGDDPLTFPGVGHFRRWDPFTVALRLRVPEAYPRAVVLHRSKSWTDSGSRGWQLLVEDGRLSAALVHFWPGDAACVRTVAPLPVGEWVHVAVTWDGSSRAQGLAVYLDGERAPVEVVRDGLSRMIVRGAEGDVTIGERFRDNGLRGGRVDDLALFDRELAPDEVLQLADGVVRPPSFERWLAAVDPRARAAREALRAARRARDELRDGVRQIMTMRAIEEPRPTYFLTRGRYDARGEEVAADVPAVLPPLPRAAERAPDRLDLARWLVDPEHPLTARVAVNRLWQLAFGRGLVETTEDFGSQGTPPSHPALLDHLARSFVDSGWDVKVLLRRLVLSSTYRQSSRAGPAARERDPSNRLLSRAPSPRLSAEMLRDGALLTGGLLVERRGGPPVRPYQPPGLWEEKSGVAYQQDHGEGLYRRSLYTIWKRTSPPPAMMLLDAAKRDVCVARRQRTQTPLQALVLWNDPQLVEAARGLGERMLAAAGDAPGRAAYAFRVLTARAPTAAETRVLAGLYADLRADLAAHEDDVAALLAVGERPLDPDLDPLELATCTLVASTLQGHDATVRRR